MKKKICFVTGSRAEYGLLKPLMKRLAADPAFDFKLIVTGSHLSEKHGGTLAEIRKGGFGIDEKISILSGKDRRGDIAEAAAKALAGFSKALEKIQPDILVLLGDRYEVFAAAEAALLHRVPVAHISGGDSTEGAFDEALRHGITKMSHLHFATNAVSAARLIQMGEDPANVFNAGSLAIDAIRNTRFFERAEVAARLGFEFKEKNILVTFHPATLEDTPSRVQFKELLSALGKLGKDVGFIFTGANADPEGLELNRMAKRFVRGRANALFRESLGQELYFNVLAQVDAAVGNSSSGLYEAPSFKKSTVNIGDRQKGRLKAASVVDAAPESGEIFQAIQAALTMDCRRTLNPYGSGRAAEKIHAVLRSADLSGLLKKRFFDAPAGRSSRVLVIAEAGVNHNGSLEMAKKLVDAAKAAGADAVKFQTFKADQLAAAGAETAAYQKKSGAGGSQLQMLKKLELGAEAHRQLKEHCAKKGIEFLSTPFDASSVDFLAELGVRRFKISSGDLTNAPLLLQIAKKGPPVILSTGMADLREIEEALGVLAFGFLGKSAPSKKAFREAFFSQEGRRRLAQRVTILHCVTAYPAPFEETNLRAMDALASKFGLPVGFSDHTEGIAAALAACARGAVVLEKHLTLDKKLPGPDHRASLEPEEFAAMVRGIRQIEAALGLPLKAPVPSEIANITAARKSLVASRPVRKGEKFSSSNIAAKRPGKGASPMDYWDILNGKASRDYAKDEAISS